MYLINNYLIILFLLLSATITSQVAINTSQLDAGAIFQVESDDKGVLIPRIALNSSNDITTITSPAIGLIIYNTRTENTISNPISPGLYHWNGEQWIRVFAQGYSKQFIQTSQNLVSTLADVPINGLNQNIEVPFSGVYRITVTSYLGAARVSNSNQSEENVAISSIRLEIDNQVISEKLIPTFSKVVDNTSTGGNGTTNFFGLSRQSVLTKDVTLEAGRTYNLNVIGRLWAWTNVAPAIGGFTYIGLDTSLYERNPGFTDEASRTKLTINLIQQF